MQRKWKKMLVWPLMFVMLLSTMSLTASAEDGAAETPQDPFVFICPSAGVDSDGDLIPSRWYKNGAGGKTWVSKHTIGYNFVYLDGSFMDEGYAMRVTTGLFHLDRTDGIEESYAAYCCDFACSAYGDALYRRVNLEDATYFTDEEAAHIRGIFAHGYWLDWDVDPETYLLREQTAANQWLENKWLMENPSVNEEPGDSESEEENTAGTQAQKPEIAGLTIDQAMTATQLAIWNFANSEEGWYTYEYFPSSVELNEHNTPEASSNIMLFRDYLINQTAEYAETEDILFSDGQFVSASAVLSAGGEVDYDITLRFKLAGPVEQTDDLTVTAAVGNQTVTQALTGSGADASGYYSVMISGVSREEAEAAGYRISLTLSGSQMANGIYFYEAKDPDGNGSRHASQNLVGKAVGSTPVAAVCEIPFELGEKNVSLYKYDAGSGQSESVDGFVLVDGMYYRPLPGAVFDLYAKAGGVDVLLKSGLTSDATGHIVVTGLADGYSYYFKETTPPVGYDQNLYEQQAQLWASSDLETPVYVPNSETVYVPVTTFLRVEKVWVGDVEAERPAEIQVQLLQDGEPYGRPVALSEANDWNYTWSGLEVGYTWGAIEVEVPEGYTSRQVHSGQDVTIINTAKETPIIPEIPEEPDVPEYPEIPEEPEPSQEPEIPEEPEPSQGPEVPEEPEQPDILEDEKPDESEVFAQVPQTGDPILLLVMGAVLAGSGLAGLVFLGKKRRCEK